MYPVAVLILLCARFHEHVVHPEKVEAHKRKQAVASKRKTFVKYLRQLCTRFVLITTPFLFSIVYNV